MEKQINELLNADKEQEACALLVKHKDTIDLNAKMLCVPYLDDARGRNLTAACMRGHWKFICLALHLDFKIKPNFSQECPYYDINGHTYASSPLVAAFANGCREILSMLIYDNKQRLIEHNLLYSRLKSKRDEFIKFIVAHATWETWTSWDLDDYLEAHRNNYCGRNELVRMREEGEGVKKKFMQEIGWDIVPSARIYCFIIMLNSQLYEIKI